MMRWGSARRRAPAGAPAMTRGGGGEPNTTASWRIPYRASVGGIRVAGQGCMATRRGDLLDLLPALVGMPASPRGGYQRRLWQRPESRRVVKAEVMPAHLLKGLRVLVASNHRHLVRMFASMVGLCGGVAWVARCATDAVSALSGRPHVVLLDPGLPDDLLTVPASAASFDVPVVAVAFRNRDSRCLPAGLRAFDVQLLRSTDLYEVCGTLREAVRRCALGEVHIER